MPVKPIAFYLPQFHRIPENDRWWGEGFTEWTLVRRAEPLFPGHQQPDVPADRPGWYDLLDPEVRRWQADLARAHGIHGFCYYHYWFRGKQLLERPLALMLEDGQPDLPFALCWANEPWSRRWDGKEHDVLQGQDYGEEADWLAHFEYLRRLFEHPRYIRVDGRPMFLIYRHGHIAPLVPMLDTWRRRAREIGLPGLHLVAILGGTTDNFYVPDCMDAGCEFQPSYMGALGVPIQQRDGVRVISSEVAWKSILELPKAHPVHYRGAFVGWDNTPRCGRNGLVYTPLEPTRLGELLERQMRRVLDDPGLPEPFLFVNAWNEWSEGCYLEPDQRHGTEVLEAMRDAVARSAAPPSARDGLLIVLGCEFLDNGDGVHRFHAPSRSLSRLPGVTVVECDVGHHHFHDLARAADVLVLAGFDSDMFPLIEMRRSEGRATVLEANDYYFDIQPWSPLSARWYDRALRDTFLHGLAVFDGIQTSMPELARRWRERTERPVATFPNQLLEVPPLSEVPERPLTIGWGGSIGHFADWYHVAPLLQRWLDAHAEVHLSIMGDEPLRAFIHLPEDRYRFTPFGSLDAYFEFLRGLDIGLAPLLPTDFNRCRSDVKFLEYAACGVAGIYADLEPYRETVVDGETGLLYRDDDDFLHQLDRLANDAALRRRIRAQAHEHVSRRRRLDSHVGERLAVYRGLLTVPPRGTALAPEILGEAARDGRCFQLRRGEAEETVRLAAAQPAGQASVSALVTVLQRHPRYLGALQALGRQLNDLRQPDQALEVLLRARALAPSSARTLSELARAAFMGGHAEEARGLLEGALVLNPRSQTAWQSLLRVLARTGAANVASWVERARAANPSNYALTLVAAGLLEGQQRITVVWECLDTCAPTLAPDETPLGMAAFSESIAAIPGPSLGSDAGLQLLERACELFPQSARLATLHGQVLRSRGREAESLEQLRRASALRLAARAYQAEFPKENGATWMWQLADAIHDATIETT